MTKTPNTIDKFLDLERLEVNLYRGHSQDVGTPQVFGGQVLAQAVAAAQRTVLDRQVHSIHASFLRRGDFNSPIVYEVDRSRDGKSFASRRVVAIQHGQPIFTMEASFQASESGLEHSTVFDMPAIPEGGITGDKPDPFRDTKVESTPLPPSEFDLSVLDVGEQKDPMSLQMWIKKRDALNATQATHQALLAYISDYALLLGTVLPHMERVPGQKLAFPELQYATINHAIWFHHPVKIDDWLLYVCKPVSSSGARGTAQGSFYNRDGLLMATTMQEGLIRQQKS